MRANESSKEEGKTRTEVKERSGNGQNKKGKSDQDSRENNIPTFRLVLKRKKIKKQKKRRERQEIQIEKEID